MGFLKFVQKLEPNKEKSPFLWTVYEGLYTFLYVPNKVTSKGVHIKDTMDLKRLMTMVVLAIMPLFIFAMFNTGHQHFLALGQYPGFFDAWHLKFAHGAIKFIPIFIISMGVGLGIEFFYASKRGHGIEEGYLVSGALIPLIMPPDVPLWMLTVAIVFAVIIGKEAFGGTGMNVLNVALLARVFIFFAYPSAISGDSVWVSGVADLAAGSGVDYSWWHTGFFNSIFEAFGWSTFDSGATVIDGFTGATPLALAAGGGMSAVNEVYSNSQLLWGSIPGSVGETAKPLIIFGAIFLIITRVASWRIMVSAILGAAIIGMLLNVAAPNPEGFMAVPWQYHFLMGGMLFAIAFMATDPVTSANTQLGKWIYGFILGALGMVVRVLNPAYPEGWMMAILFMNVFAPLIDYYIIQSNISKRLKRA